MLNDHLSLRQRFDNLRASMRWSWKDIDLITGRKNARTNIAKRVPAWSILAIYTHESHAVLLRQHIIVLVGLHLGSNWQQSKLSGNAVAFHGSSQSRDSVDSIIVDFKNTSFIIVSSSSNIYEVAEKLKPLYPIQGDVVKNSDNDFEIEIPIHLH